MAKKTKFDGDIKCEIPSGVLKGFVSYYWSHRPQVMNQEIPTTIKLSIAEVKEKTVSTFSWSKGIWKKGEIKPERRIFVISLDTQDFINWKRNSKFAQIPLDVPRRFKDGKDTYQCITDVCGLKSYTADKVIETEHAVENPDYYQIIESSKLCLKSNNI